MSRRPTVRRKTVELRGGGSVRVEIRGLTLTAEDWRLCSVIADALDRYVRASAGDAGAEREATPLTAGDERHGPTVPAADRRHGGGVPAAHERHDSRTVPPESGSEAPSLPPEDAD